MRGEGGISVRQLAWSLLALVVSVALGIWVLDFTGVIDLAGVVLAQLRHVPVVADYIDASERVRRWDEEQARARAALEQMRQELEQQQKALAAKADELARREKELQAREAQLDEMARRLAEREQALALAAEQDRYYRELIEAVGRMRPEEAAPIIERLDLELARRLLGSMDPRQAGSILGKMDPQHASRLLAAVSGVLTSAR